MIKVMTVKPKLLDQVRHATRVRHLSYKTEKKKGPSLLLTLINTVLYFPYLLFNFSVIFFKPRNSKPLT
jgi:hypothetical protein